MGVYLYGIKKSKKINVEGRSVHLSEFMAKPHREDYDGMGGIIGRLGGLIKRIDKAWG